MNPDAIEVKRILSRMEKFFFYTFRIFKLISLIRPNFNPFLFVEGKKNLYLLSKCASGFTKARGLVNVVFSPKNAWS